MSEIFVKVSDTLEMSSFGISGLSFRMAIESLLAGITLPKLLAPLQIVVWTRKLTRPPSSLAQREVRSDPTRRARGGSRGHSESVRSFPERPADVQHPLVTIFLAVADKVRGAYVSSLLLSPTIVDVGSATIVY